MSKKVIDFVNLFDRTGVLMGFTTFDDFFLFYSGYVYNNQHNDEFIQFMNSFEKYIQKEYKEYNVNNNDAYKLLKLLTLNRFSNLIYLIDQFLKEENRKHFDLYRYKRNNL